MEKSSTIKANEILPEFQRFLPEKKLAPEKNVFFTPCGPVNFSILLAKSKYLQSYIRKTPSVNFWKLSNQIPMSQTGRSDRPAMQSAFYYFHYRGLRPAQIQAIKTAESAPARLKETTRLLRMKHYSYSAERTYLHWIKRFLDYGAQTREKETVVAFDGGQESFDGGAAVRIGAAMSESDCPHFLPFLSIVL